MTPLITIFLKDVLIPEVMRAIRNHQAANNGKFPTEAEVFAALEKTTSEGIAEGQAFLDRTKPTDVRSTTPIPPKNG